MGNQEQIEEMVLAVYPWLKEIPIEERKQLSKNVSGLMVMEHLYNAGYRKIPEGAVLLTKEEYEQQQKDNEDFDKFARSISDIRMKNGNKIATFKDLQDYIELQVKQGSKEMAEKIMNEISGDVLIVNTKEYGNIEVVPVERLQEIIQTLEVN